MLTDKHVCVILALCFSLICGMQVRAEQRSTDTVKRGDDTLYYLNIRNPNLTQPVGSAGEVERAKFVQVEVVRVLNPRRRALTFQVHYQPRGGARIYLGSFSLYPADNPGKFIVPTQGKVKDDGAIVLSMLILDKLNADDAVEVAVKAIRFVSGES